VKSSDDAKEYMLRLQFKTTVRSHGG